MNQSNKLGFTLIELLAVIAILAAIMLIIIPLVTNSVRESSETAMAQNQESIEFSARNWVSDNKNKLPTNDEEICISIRALIQEGYLDNSVQDDYINSSVVISNANDVYYYSFQEVQCADETGIYKTLSFNYTVNSGSKPNGQPDSIEMIAGETIDLSDYSAERSGYEFVGWNSNKDAYSGFSEYTMPTEDVTLYAIYKKTLTAKFEIQNKEIAQTDKEEVSCTIYNNSTECSIVVPTLTSISGSEVIGWNSNKNATTAEIENEETVNISKNKTYYSIIEITDKEPPICILSISSDTSRINNWYTSDVEIKMTTSDSGGSGLKQYGLTTESTVSYNSATTATHKSDGSSITYYGYVEDGAGNTSQCSITFKRNAT